MKPFARDAVNGERRVWTISERCRVTILASTDVGSNLHFEIPQSSQQSFIEGKRVMLIGVMTSICDDKKSVNIRLLAPT